MNKHLRSFAREALSWARCTPSVSIHLACIAVIWVGWSWTAVGVAAALYLVRMFAITGFYHRYFSHRAFKTSRPMQFVLAVMGCSSMQGGPMWWSSHHRHHHKHSDQEADLHSPTIHGVLWSHMGWMAEPRAAQTLTSHVKDLAKYPELGWLDRNHLIVPGTLALVMLGMGEALRLYAPQLGVSGLQLLVWGFCISTVVLFHGTCTINSLSHLFGKRRYPTTDTSRNNALLAMLTLGEGWHNNHHYYPGSARQGFFWWEIDITYYGLVMLSWTGLIWDLRPVPAHIKYGTETRANRRVA